MFLKLNFLEKPTHAEAEMMIFEKNKILDVLYVVNNKFKWWT